MCLLLNCFSSVCRPVANAGEFQKKIAAFYKDVKKIIRTPKFKKYIPPNAEDEIKSLKKDIKKRDSPIVLAGKLWIFS